MNSRFVCADGAFASGTSTVSRCTCTWLLFFNCTLRISFFVFFNLFDCVPGGGVVKNLFIVIMFCGSEKNRWWC